MPDKSKEELNRKGILMLVGAGVIVVALFAAQAILTMGRGDRGEDLCLQGKPIKGHTVILIDTTDPLSAEENRQLRKRVEQVREKVAKDAKLSVFFIDDKSADMLDEQFCRCNPGSASDANPLVSAPRRIAKKWNTSFGTPLDSALHLASARPASRSSPIMEAITYVTEREDFAASIPGRRIVLISDLVQHSAVYSLLRGASTYASFQRQARDEGMIPDLKGAEVEIDQLMRPNYRLVQTDRLRDFWRSYFRDAGVSADVRIRAVRGTYRVEGGEFVHRDEPATVTSGDDVPGADAPSAERAGDGSNTWEKGELDSDLEDSRTLEADPASPSASESAPPGEPHPPAPVESAARARSDATVDAEPASTSQAYVDEFPKVVKQVAPHYPDLARSSGAEGVVIVNAMVGPDGYVKDVKVLRSIPMLDGAAMEAVRQWRFKPGSINGKPIHVWVAVPVRFKKTS